MTQVSEGRKASFLLFDIRLVIAIAGVLMSILLHELLHVALHWNTLTAIRVFPEPYVIAEVEFLVNIGYNMLIEEIVAYSISIFVLVGTAMLVLQLPSRRTGQSLGNTLLASIRTFSERVAA